MISLKNTNKIISLAYRIEVFLWRILKPKTFGVRALLIKEGNILLVKHTYQSFWYLPGGGLKNGETYDEALKRELKEELNAEISNLELFGVYNSSYEGKKDSIVIFLCKEFKLELNKKNGEISEIQYFRLTDLPHNISSGSLKRINEYRDNKYPSFGKW